MSPSALIEMGVEEFPLGSLDLLYAQARDRIREILVRHRFEFKDVFFEATPRRLAFFVQDLAAKQKEECTVILGPAYEKAYDAEGKPTVALQGFLKSRGASIKKVKVHPTPRGRYVALEKIHRGEATTKLLPRVTTELLNSFSFPKTMRWEKSGFRFPRPIRWGVVLYGNRALSFSLAGIKTGRVTRGHRFLSKRPLSLPRADWRDYAKRLKSEHVILSLKAREALIHQGLKKKFQQKEWDEDLVRETACLVEEPFLIQGKFSGTYRDLPEEVLATCMKKYQKVFALRDGRGHLLNRFVAVLNGRRSGLPRIREDYENVLESRLRDAQYFYEEDTKEPLQAKLPHLKELTFLGRLGNMEERTQRLKELAKDLVARIGRDADLEQKLERVAALSKADLVTHLVGEFPELQGMVGREYAREAGEPEEVARAIGEQYLPKNLAEPFTNLPRRISRLGALFGIVDRLDLLVGALGIGFEPSGSEDPYALRRAGGVLVKLIRAFAFSFPLSALLRESYETYQGKLELSFEALLSKLNAFFRDRLVFELQVKSGTQAHEILQGVMRSSFEDLKDVFERFEVLTRLAAKHPKIFFQTSKVVERTSNILKGVREDLDSLEPQLFQESLERELFDRLQAKRSELEHATQARDYEHVTRLYGETFFDPLHEFFDRVMVNVDDPKLRRNRQALMKRINQLYTEKVADLSVLSQIKE